MKKRILILGMVVALVSVLVMPTAALATTTGVTGDVIQGYTFAAPSPIALGSMTPGQADVGQSATDGSLEGNDPAGYTVTGIDEKVTDTGKMVVGGNILSELHQIGPAANQLGPANVAQTFLDTITITDATFEFHVSQYVTYADPVASGYTITITFTVTPKT